MRRLFVVVLAAAAALPALAEEPAPPSAPFFTSAPAGAAAVTTPPPSAGAAAVPAAAAAEPMPPLDTYAGAEGCKKCHEDKYNGWKRTFHSTVVQDAKARPDSVLGDFSQPGIGFTLDEVEYTVGGHWNQRYMKKIGDDYYVLPKSWSISSRRWENYNVWGWKKMPYSKFCQGCHVTRYDPTDGSLVEHTIGCESCHGPGRKHAETESKDAILHPGKLGVQMEYICAACHVRGKDPSGEYQFPVGYIPGRDLALYYIPNKVLEDEAIGDALLREFRTWWGNVGAANTECEVCGIQPGGENGKDKEKEKGKQKTITEYCMGCHKYGEAYSRHTNHDPKVADLQCFDCHKKVEVMEEDTSEDVHSVGYFLVHKRTCYDKDYAKACKGCHDTWTADKVKEKLSTWSGRSTVHD